jgi:hypothetical protein
MKVFSCTSRIAAAGLLAAELCACTATPGIMNADGSINPCYGFHVSPQACGDAIYNAERIKNVQIGQSQSDVRQVMGREAELRGVSLQGGQRMETWTFLTDYASQIRTSVDFVDGKVVAIRPWSAIAR